jgi:hypothetical protein
VSHAANVLKQLLADYTRAVNDDEDWYWVDEVANRINALEAPMVPCPSCAHLNTKPAYCDRCEGGGIVRAVDKATSSPARLTDSESGKADGSAEKDL